MSPHIKSASIVYHAATAKVKNRAESFNGNSANQPACKPRARAKPRKGRARAEDARKITCVAYALRIYYHS